MKAAVIYDYGGIENVKIEEVPQPKAQKVEAVIKIKSCGLNHLDIRVIKGRGTKKLTEAHIIGSDASGIVQSLGADVVIDSVGAATWPIDLAAVCKGGTVVICGITSGAKAETNLQVLYWNQSKIFGSDEDMRQMLKAVSTAKLKPIIDSVKLFQMFGKHLAEWKQQNSSARLC